MFRSPMIADPGCRRRVALLVGLVLPLAAATAAGKLRVGDLPRDHDAWIQVKSPNFLLWSDAGEGRTRDIAVELEQMRAGLAQLSPALALGAARPSYLYVFKNQFAFTPYRFRVRGKRVEVAGTSCSALGPTMWPSTATRASMRCMPFGTSTCTT